MVRKMTDKFLQVLVDFKTPLDRKGNNIGDFLTDLYRRYLDELRNFSGAENNPTLGQKTCELVSKKISAIDSLCNAIVNAIRSYEAGSISEGRQILFAALDAIKNDLSVQYTGAHRWEYYYRIRSREAETDFNLERKELFHIPYDKREYASSERFSVAGYPCLYLSSQYEICWCECHKPKKFALAAFEVPQTRDDMAKMVDIGEAMIPLAHSFFCWFYNERNSESELEKIRAYLVKQLVTYPLRAACSIMVTDRKAAGKPEYIIPQMLMQWLQQDDEFDGVRYETAVDYSEMRFAGGHNLAFVTKDFDSEGYAQELRKRIKVGTPIWVKLDEVKVFEDRNPEDNPYLWLLDIPTDFETI